MSDQPGLFDSKVAEKLRDAAIDQVGDAVDEHWRQEAVEAVLTVAARGGDFTTEDVWKLITKPREPRALGAIMRILAKEGVIEPTPRFVQGTMTSRHRAPIRVWRPVGTRRVAGEMA